MLFSSSTTSARSFSYMARAGRRPQIRFHLKFGFWATQVGTSCTHKNLTKKHETFTADYHLFRTGRYGRYLPPQKPKMRGGTSLPFNSEIAYLGNRDMKNFVLQKLCSAQNSAK